MTKVNEMGGRSTDNRKQAEEALGQSDARYRLLYESMTDCFVQVAMSGEIIEANRSYLEMLGYTEEEVRKLRYQDITPAQWHEIDHKIIETQVKARGYSDIYEQEYIKKDGTVFPVELRTYLLRNTDGKPFGMWTIIRDITERKRADGKVRETSVYTRSLIEASLDPLVTISPQGNITDVNKATELATGVPREKLIGSDFSHYFTEPEKARAVYQRVFDNGLVKDYPLIIRHISGSTTDVLYNASVYKDSTGNVAGVFAAARDITEHKMVEEALKDSEEQHRRLVEYSPYGIAIHSEGKLVYMNLAGAKILGTENPDEFVGKTIFQIIHPDYHEITKNRIRMQEEGKVAPPLDEKFLRLDSTSVDVEVSSIPFIYIGKLAMYGVFREITQRKRAEQELMAARDEAEHANMAKTNFLQTMSHELRTPLNAVLGFSEMLKQKTSGELNGKQEHFIDNIIKGGNNLHNILGQILEVVKMYEGTLELHIEKIPVPETLDEIIGVIKEKAAKKNVLIEKNLDPELEYIEADKQKFKQVFINLLDNAVKFSKDEGGTVTINAIKEGDMARFSVSDRGIGIKEEDIEKIFQKFTQLESGTSRKYGGVGISLAISKKFVELHGGRIWAQSRYGEGSTFTFTLPFKSKEESSKTKGEGC